MRQVVERRRKMKRTLAMTSCGYWIASRTDQFPPRGPPEQSADFRTDLLYCYHAPTFQLDDPAILQRVMSSAVWAAASAPVFSDLERNLSCRRRVYCVRFPAGLGRWTSRHGSTLLALLRWTSWGKVDCQNCRRGKHAKMMHSWRSCWMCSTVEVLLHSISNCCWIYRLPNKLVIEKKS